MSSRLDTAMILTAMQPGYMPWDGYFERIKMADLYVMSDDVPMDGGGVVNRNKVRASNEQGWTWLTVPVRKASGVPIRDLEIVNDSPWQRKHHRTLEQAYGPLPDYLHYVYAARWENLSDLLWAMFEWFADRLAIETPWWAGSIVKPAGHKTERLVNLCKTYGADTYLSGPMGRQYLELDLFADAGIKVQFHDYEPVGLGLSVLDQILGRQ